MAHHRFIVASVGLLIISACSEPAWIPALPLEACPEVQVGPDPDQVGPHACSCPTLEDQETWTVSGTSQCTLGAPANPVCSATQTGSSAWTLDCEYDHGAAACAALKFSKGFNSNNLTGFAVNDPVCYSNPASPSTASNVTTRIEIPSSGINTVVWDPWTGSKDCEIQILISKTDDQRSIP